MSNLPAQKAAQDYLKSIEPAVQYHDGASIGNIVSGYRKDTAGALKEVTSYCRREGLKLTEEQIDTLISLTHAALPAQNAYRLV
jgi:hypothetical protein